MMINYDGDNNIRQQTSGKSLMKGDDSYLNGNSQIMELSQVSLFQDDPYCDQIDVLRSSSSEIFSQKMHLLQGQSLWHQNSFRVGLQGQSKILNGDYDGFASNYRAFFFPFHKEQQKNGNVQRLEVPVSIPFSMMSEIDIIKSQMMIKLKTGSTILIKSSTKEIQQLHRYFLKGYMEIPFFPKYIFDKEDSVYYDCLVQMQRMRMNWQYLILVKNSYGQLCPTYPKYFIVPKNIQQNLLEECLKIRNAARIPVATYYWADCRAALWRTSRLKPNHENSKFNQAYIKEINREPFFIDMRQEEPPFTENYIMKNTNFLIKFLPLLNLNNLFKKLCVSYAKDENIMKLVEKWYEQIFNLLQCSYLSVDQLRVGRQLILVEQMGTDRTCQVSALAQVIIDPFYRTIAGFSILIEKQFVSFGHPFNFRLGFQRQKLNEESPIFIQFLQCVHHLMVTHPKCFEFSSFYLARIAYEALSGKYNNFFFNDEDGRKKYQMIMRTKNIWKNMPMRKEYYNYQWNQRYAVKPLIAIRQTPSIKQFQMWRQFYDLISEMRGEFSPEVNVRQRKGSLYKMLNHRK